MTILFLIFFMVTGFCAGDNHSSVGDLFWPFLNVGILLTFLWIVLGRKGSVWFAAYAASVRESYEYATKKDLKAQTGLDDLQKKLNNLPTEFQRIKEEAKVQNNRWEEEQKKQTIAQLEQMRKDTRDRIGYEKKTMMDQINRILAREVVEKVKSEIRKNTKWNKQIHRNLLDKLDI